MRELHAVVATARFLAEARRPLPGDLLGVAERVRDGCSDANAVCVSVGVVVDGERSSVAVGALGAVAGDGAYRRPGARAHEARRSSGDGVEVEASLWFPEDAPSAPSASDAAFLEATADLLLAHVERLQSERAGARKRAATTRQALGDLYGSVRTGWSPEVAARVLDVAMTLVPSATHGSVLVRTDDGSFGFAAVRGFDLASLRAVRVPADEVLFGQDWRSAWPFVVAGVVDANATVAARVPSLAPLVDATRSAGIEVSLAVPMVHRGELQAAVVLDQAGERPGFGSDDELAMATFANGVAALLQRREAEVRTALMERAVGLATEGVAIVAVRPSGERARVRYCNAAFSATFGFDVARTDEWRVAEAVDADDAVRLRAAVMDVVADGREARMDLRVHPPAGSDPPRAVARWVEMVVTSVPSRDDDATVLVVVRDVDERYRLTDALSRANADLEDRLRETRSMEAVDRAIVVGSDEGSILRGALDAVRGWTGVGDAHLLTLVGGALRAPIDDRDGPACLDLSARAVRDAQVVVEPLAEPAGALREAWPLESKGRTVGVLCLDLEPDFVPTAAWRRFVSVLSTQVAIAVEHAQMFGNLQRSADAYAALAVFSEAIERLDDPTELIDLGVRTLLDEFGMHRAGYYVRHEGEGIEPVRFWGEVAPAVREVVETPQRLGVGAIGIALERGELVYVPDYAAWSHAMPSVVAAGFRSILVAPVRSDGEVRGAIALGSYAQTVELRPDQLAIARTFVRRLERALDQLAHEQQMVRTREDAFRALGVALEHRDYETRGHTDRVVALARRFGTHVGLDGASFEALAWGAYLHDLGKITIPDTILLKPGRLTRDEFAEIERHTVVGFEMSRTLTFLPEATRMVVRSHHERWDGSGYPDGLAGDEIPYLARLFSLVDVYDALTSERPYKHAWPHDDAVAEIERQSGAQFDPGLTATFLEVLRDDRSA